MQRKLLLVDYENKHKLDLSALDDSYSAIIFVGHHQPEDKVKRKIESKNKFVRIDYQKVIGHGKNALDFHIAYTLGKKYQIDPTLHCYILSSDKGFDPLIKNLEVEKYWCKRIESVTELSNAKHSEKTINIIPLRNKSKAVKSELSACRFCKKSSTIEHNGGRWCSNCGKFSQQPSSDVLSELSIAYPTRTIHHVSRSISNIFCCSCSQNIESGDGIYDDGEWTCWACLGV